MEKGIRLKDGSYRFTVVDIFDLKVSGKKLISGDYITNPGKSRMLIEYYDGSDLEKAIINGRIKIGQSFNLLVSKNQTKQELISILQPRIHVEIPKQN